MRLLIAFPFFFGLFLCVSLCFGSQIDLSAIATIESSGNPKAYNSRTKATGLYQITPICLADYNQYHKIKYTMDDMFDADKCYTVAYWYLNVRIPQMLRHYGHEQSFENILIAYNWGIGNVGKSLPKETSDYIAKYKARVLR